ncbi:diguanylate cyclase with PAS/PAC sensor (plasmid) [Peptoclostridium acidaminophilum DSM 3953]|uniref:Diguanylate cyclase with PAS/PAC sensor n=1 Tax=Peptoclostridium acidaminophilum DSM 3953 TaxID=1286171 RepID=W8UBY9_PEPAC|nr:transporter substrate-binding domain-containing protein [Peptoclostridium acidaminophilum]AHM58236.1 diguanylate cyclase with PAS/PAC sensor [Peptoclostridium acidaminophilum DSM 3953]
MKNVSGKISLAKAVFISLAVIMLSVLFATLPGFAYDKYDLQKKPAIEKIRVVLEDNYPPYSFRASDGSLHGILIDQWALWEKKTGVKVIIEAKDWNSALTEMNQGKHDVIDSISFSDERAALFDFTKPHSSAEVPIFFSKNISGIKGIRSLKGFSVAVEKGDIIADILRDAGIKSLVEYDSYESIIEAASKGEVVVFVMNRAPAMHMIYKYGLQSEFTSTDSICIIELRRAIKKGDTELLALVENGFEKITQSEYREIDNRWSGFQNYNTDKIASYIETISFFAFSILILLLVWNYALRRNVNAKTSELTAALSELESSQEQIRAIIDAMPDMIFIVDSEGVFLDYLSRKQKESLLVQPEDFIGRKIADLFPYDITAKFMKGIDIVKNTGKNTMLEYGLGNNHYEARYIPLSESRMLCIVRDITEQRLSQEKIYQMSVYDEPTGLFNRNYFENELGNIEGECKPGMAVVMCDIDGLKLVNDTLGHLEGDAYLITAANIIKSHFADSRLIARIGGDEFAVILERATEESILKTKEKIKEHLTLINQSERLLPISLSIGYGIVSRISPSIADAMKEADDFMYREKLHHKLSFRSKNIDFIKKMLETRDFITEGHGRRMEDLCITLAYRMGLSQKDVKDMALFAQFHDIGKIGISDSILFKPGRLTEDEFEEMKKHAELGYRIAESSPDIMHISELIFKHHEWWNGSGYPFGLKGEEIPLQCRILSVVDAYDAMTNSRPYRKAMPSEDALQELRRFSGVQFDPSVVDMLIDILASPDALPSQYNPS